MKAVFLDQQSFIDTISFDAIQQQVSTLTSYPLTTPEQIIARCLDAEIIITNKVVINRQIIEQLPKLKLICIAATGMNNVDIPTAQKHGINVMNVAGYSTNSVSQYVFAQLLEFYSQTSKNNQKVQSGQWQQSPVFCLHSDFFDELAGKTLGIFGYGALGKKVASIALAFDMKVIISERPNTANIRQGRISFDDMLAQADIVSLHCPHTPETELLFSTDVFAKMQPHAVLINTARGAVIDNKALKKALNDKQIAAAILDVLDQEPPPHDHILLNSQPDNLFITGHIAWASQQAQQRLVNLIAENIQTFKNS